MTTIVLDTPERRAVFHALQLKSALGLYIKTGMFVTRGATPRRLLDLASAYTGKKYKNSPAQREACLADLEAFLKPHLEARTLASPQA
jgi:anion-transporting  ArsA/GET3 family ATPase